MKLEIQNLSFSYGKYSVFSDFNLCLKEGVYGLLGPNGAGKTTLINLLVTNLVPNTGIITWNGDDIHKLLKEYRRVIGFKPQHQSIYPELTLEEFLNYMGNLKEISSKECKTQIDYLLEKLNLLPQRKKKMKKLSGGMLQRALLAQALLGEPKLLILDEPTAGLDPMERIRMRELIATLSKDKIIIIATHIIEDISTISDEIIFMNHGEILLKGNMDVLNEYYNQGLSEGKMQNIVMENEIMILENLYYELFQ